MSDYETAGAIAVQFDVERALEEYRESGSNHAAASLILAVLHAQRQDTRTWPRGRDVGRVGDMAPPEKSHMRIALDGDNDVCVEIWDAERGQGKRAAIEFCSGHGGGGKSVKTREALIAVMVAMEEDNATVPRGRFPPLDPAT